MRKLSALTTLSILLALAGASLAQEISTEHYKKLRYRHIGPVGNRVIAVVGVPGDPRIYYAGAASGGIWKTEDGGLNWEPIFDDQPVHSIGSLAVAPSDSNIVWAGTGETFIRANVSIGNGIWKSTDGGTSWEHMGLEGTADASDASSSIRRIQTSFTRRHWATATAPRKSAASTALPTAATRGSTFCSWTRTPEPPTWSWIPTTRGSSSPVCGRSRSRLGSGGPGSGLFVSRDSGDTWTRLEGNGLPKGPVGKVAGCMTPSSSDRIYVLIETSDGVPWEGEGTEKGELWRSDDGGRKWELVSYDGASAIKCWWLPRNPLVC